jgi:hypothetical protein
VANVAIRVILLPNLFISIPEKTPPVMPPIPSRIMISPRSFCPSCPVASNVCTHVGNHENMPQSPISTDPKMIDPEIRLALFVLSKIPSPFFQRSLVCFHLSDSGASRKISSAAITGIIRCRKQYASWKKSG